jgi:hypothetical protein
MILIQGATVETLDNTQARPVTNPSRTVLSVTIGDHTFDMLVDEHELREAMASQQDVQYPTDEYGCFCKPCTTPAP